LRIALPGIYDLYGEDATPLTEASAPEMGELLGQDERGDEPAGWQGAQHLHDLHISPRQKPNWNKICAWASTSRICAWSKNASPSAQ